MSALAKTNEVTIYCVQPFWRNGKGDLAQGRLRQFRDEAGARAAATQAWESSANAGVIAFGITGIPEFDTWGDPWLVASYGDVPELG